MLTRIASTFLMNTELSENLSNLWTTGENMNEIEG